MNHQALHMTSMFEKEKNIKAAGYTALVVILLLLIFIFTKMAAPPIAQEPPDTFVEVELGDIEVVPYNVVGGGGGGGNPVDAPGDPGTAYAPPQQGEEDVKDVETDDNAKDVPEIIKPTNPKPESKNINNNSAPVKPVKDPPPPAPPAPPKPKATLGKTTGGNSTGGNNSTTGYDKPGGTGSGSGVGNGSGTGGGSGTGSGGGNGSGSGSGAGPKKISGNRNVISGTRNMDAGENLRGKIHAEIKVSPDGIGTYIRSVQGTTLTNPQAVSIIRDWLRTHRFNKTAEESIVVYQFNFNLGG